VQSSKDRVRIPDGSSNNNTLSLDNLTGDNDPTGSIFLSCLALILQSRDSHNNLDGRRSHERVFAAQILNHRCRAVKLVEALDIEAEDGVECGVARLVMALEEIRAEKAQLNATNTSNDQNQNALSEKFNAILTAWLERYVPMLVHRCAGSESNSTNNNCTLCEGTKLLSLVLQRNSSSLLTNATNVDEEHREAQIKGTLIMLSLAVAMYVSAFWDCEEEHQYNVHMQNQQQHHQHARTPWANSVLSDFGSALSVTALRMRYRPVKDKYATPSPEPSCPPLIDMLVNALNAVKESAEHLFTEAMQQHPQQQQQQLQTAIQQAHQYAVRRSIAACLKALPETVLLPPGHEDAHRIPSVDRACLRAASMELRAIGTGTINHDNNDTIIGTGMDKAWKVLTELEPGDTDASAARLLECCESWARHVAIPIPVVEVTVGSFAVRHLHSEHQPKAQAAAFQYLISIFEAASPAFTPSDILTAALGVGAGGHKGKGSRGGGGVTKKNSNKCNTKKKQGNKSKKRHDKRLGRAIAIQDGQDDGGATANDAAEKELFGRRNAACVAAAATFGVSIPDGAMADGDMGLRLAASNPSTSTHGICSTVAAAATSVLPHLLFLERSDGEGKSHHMWRLELFSTIATVIRRMCSSPIRELRALAYEPLMVLHTSLNSVEYVSLRMEQVAVDAICECTLELATSCGYPAGYFDRLYENSDEELEIERNDVRDVARSVCSLDSGVIGTQKSPSILILERIINECNNAIQHSTTSGQLPPETVVHLLSSLAKPLNKLGKKYKEQPSSIGCTIMTTSLLALGSVSGRLNASFESLSMAQILPLSRLASMASASFSPMFACLAQVMREPAASDLEKEMVRVFKGTLLSSLQHSLLSSKNIPELVAESTLSVTRYDVKGAMRGPGGEDHVGCIALVRLSRESDYLTNAVFEVYGTSILHDLSCLYQALKTSELERGFGCDHGKGVTPISRRIILRVISHLALYEMKGTNDQSSNGGTILRQLVQVPLGEMRSQKEHPFSADKVFRLSEASFDLSFFSPELVADLFDNPSDDLGIMFECVVTGYAKLACTSDADAVFHQWARLRGAALSVLRTCLKANISNYCASIISALIKAECEAAAVQSNRGPQSGSNIFSDCVIGEEMLHAGAYIVLIRECLDRIGKEEGQMEKHMEECRRCLSVLKEVSPLVMPLMLHHSPEATSHVDPRPTIAEAWFLTMTSLVSICKKHNHIASSLVKDDMESFMGESLSVTVSLSFLKDLGSRESSSPATQKGMSLDGPHTLAMNGFTSECMIAGPRILTKMGRSIVSIVQVNHIFDQSNIGVIILAASLLRAVSGALPPWSVEDTPTLAQSMYLAMHSDPDAFIEIFSAATKVTASANFGAIKSGELLAGRYLDVSNKHIESFLHQSKEVCIKGNWKKLKVILKATCGGKKKDSGFNLKPQFTSWECDRI